MCANAFSVGVINHKELAMSLIERQSNNRNAISNNTFFTFVVLLSHLDPRRK